MAMVQHRSKQDWVIDAILCVILAGLALVCLVPFLHVLAQSLSSKEAVSSDSVGLWPIGFNLDNYVFMLGDPQVVRSFGISVARVIVGVAVTMVLVVLTAYPLSRDHVSMPFRSAYKVVMLIGLMFSGGLIPLFLAFRTLHLLNTFWVLIFPVALNIFFVIVAMNFFRGIPRELEEAATMDGASHIKILFQIYVPLSKPVLATIALFAAVTHWNSWFDGAVFIQQSSGWPLQSYLYQLLATNQGMTLNPGQAAQQLQNATTGGVAAALILIASVPILVVYPFLQRYFTAGLTLGSVKE